LEPPPGGDRVHAKIHRLLPLVITPSYLCVSSARVSNGGSI
jgi:hypothetical protein